MRLGSPTGAQPRQPLCGAVARRRAPALPRLNGCGATITMLGRWALHQPPIASAGNGCCRGVHPPVKVGLVPEYRIWEWFWPVAPLALHEPRTACGLAASGRPALAACTRQSRVVDASPEAFHCFLWAHCLWLWCGWGRNGRGRRPRASCVRVASGAAFGAPPRPPRART